MHKQQAATTLVIISDLKKQVDSQSDELASLRKENKKLKNDIKSLLANEEDSQL